MNRELPTTTDTTAARRRPERAAGEAVARRMAELNVKIPAVAVKAGVDPTTIRALVRGQRWPHADTRRLIEGAIGWPQGAIAQRALQDLALSLASTSELLRELLRRAEAREAAAAN